MFRLMPPVHSLFTLCFDLDLDLWTFESVPMHMLIQFVRTRWQSKAGMLASLVQNKQLIRPICASDKEELQSMHDKDLSDTEWKLVEV